MLVEAQVSSMNTSRRGSSCFCSSRQAARAATTSGRCCSAARRVFFERQLQALQEAADVDAALKEVGGETVPQNMHADPLVETRRGRRQSGGSATIGDASGDTATLDNTRYAGERARRWRR